MAAHKELITPLKVGSLELPNRIVMSPMTRIRAGEGCVPSERMVRYYSQRASAGLIITEGTHPSPMGRGYTYPPGLHTEEQAAGWRKVTDAVHAVSSALKVAQKCGVGRAQGAGCGSRNGHILQSMQE
jgi:N-ethylmaleimide reductase